MIIFIGVLGGVMAWGFIGVFLGSTLIAIGYTLLRSWLEERPREWHAYPQRGAPCSAVCMS